MHPGSNQITSTNQTLSCQLSRTLGNNEWFDLKNSSGDSIIDQLIQLQIGERVQFGLYLLTQADSQAAFTSHCFPGVAPRGMHPELSYNHAIVSAKEAADPNVQDITYNATGSTPAPQLKYSSTGDALYFTYAPPSCGYMQKFTRLLKSCFPSNKKQKNLK